MVVRTSQLAPSTWMTARRARSKVWGCSRFLRPSLLFRTVPRLFREPSLC